jgi:renalase
VRVVVVGAGLSGLAAARRAHAGGHDVVVVDKGRGPGGRLATRRIGHATLDHGAQFFTVRGQALAEQAARWLDDGLVRVWCHGFGHDDGHPRYVATGGMNTLAKDLAAGIDLRCPALAFSIRRAPDAWRVVLDDATELVGDAVIVTCPLPQTWSLLVEAEVDVPVELLSREYDRTLALLAVLDRPSGVPDPGGLQADQLDGSPFSFVGDNQAKGVSAVPAVTFHAGPGWSEGHWEDDPTVALEALAAAAAPWLGEAAIVERQLKRWRFATPRTPWPDPCWTSADGSLVLAGDAFGGPRFEAAYDSGLAAAASL